MNEKKFEILKAKLDNLINLRTTYFSIGVVVSSGIIGLFYNISTLNIILLILGLLFNYSIVSTIASLNLRINKIFKLMEEL